MQNDLFKDDQSLSFSPIELVNEQGLMLAWPDILSSAEADSLFSELLEHSPWQQESIQIYGKIVKQPRMSCWYGLSGLSASSAYTQQQRAENFSPTLLKLKQHIETLTQFSYNSVLLNLYRNGQDSVAYHADDEPILGKHPAIASFSLGAERQFMIRNKRNKSLKQSFNLQHNSLILMAGAFQENWLHSISKTKKIQLPRINLTFRQLQL